VLKYITKRFLYIIPVMFGVLVLVFLMKVWMPGDPVTELLPISASQEERDRLREELGLNDPIPVQFVNYVWGVVTRGDLGTSYKTKQPVAVELMQRLPKTMTVAFFAIFVSQIIATPLGILAAVKQNTWIDSVIVFFTMVGAAIPNFWLALMMIMFFSVDLKWLPSMYNGTLPSWIMPIAAVAVGSIAATARGVRTHMLEIIRQDYINTARAKGQKEGIVIFKHGFRNCLIPTIAGIGNALGAQLGGALIVETVFAVPGVGKYVADAVTARNFPAVQGGVLILALIYSLINIAVDLLYTVADPRLKTNLIPKKAKKGASRTAVAAEGGA
jgi:peptide/nickel transport system permease protein